MNKKGHNTYFYLLYKMLLAFCSLEAMQILFHVANSHLFRPESFGEWAGVLWGNVVFGLASVAMVLLPFAVLMLLPMQIRWKRWYRILTEVLYVVPVLFLLVARAADSAYYQYTYRMLSNEIFTYLGNSGPMDKMIPHFMVNYWYAFVFGLAIIIAFLIVNHRIRLAKRNPNTVMTNELIGLGTGLLLVWFLMRGGFGHFLQLEDAAHYCQPKNIPLVNNSGYNIVRTLMRPQLEPHEYMPQAEADALFSPLSSPLPAPEVSDSSAVDTLPRQLPNVVLIIVESFGQEYTGIYNHQPGADTRTPFLDSLARFSTVYQGRSNGKRSIEGITAINTGIPTWMYVPFVNCTYRTDSIQGIPTVLGRHGYHTAFFHGSHNGVMDFDKVCARIGYDEYLGKNEFEADPKSRPEDFDGVWGIYDEPFLQYVVRHTSTFREPFLTTVFTVTSHDPFPIPEQYKDRFLEGLHPILKCVEYMDNALRKFFDEARRQPWFDNTIFIITGDHSGPGFTREFLNYDGGYRIPMVVFDARNPQGHVSQRIVQQTDILPSLVDWLGLDDRTLAFGQSVMQSPDRGWQIYFGNDYFVMSSNAPADPSKTNFTLLCGDREEGTPENIRFLKAVVQQYFHHVMNNQLIAQ
ncbi:MAG: LTA synthase family protein [Bacteroidales bacterium]|nr:LTA synthase family protein [Bacteroidales bacterium]